MPLLRLTPVATHGGAGALRASRAVPRAQCASQLRRRPGPALLSLRRAPRAAVRAFVTVTCAAADKAAVKRYFSDVAEELRRCGGEAYTYKLSKKLDANGLVRPVGCTRDFRKLLQTCPEMFTVERGPSSVHWSVRLLSTTASTAQTQPAAEQRHALSCAPGIAAPVAKLPRNPDVPSPRPSWAPNAARTAAQRAYAASLAAPTPYVVAVGPAGTGKTHLAVKAGAAALLSGATSRLIITRPVVAVDEDLGYLPGGTNQKMAPYLVPVFDILADIWTASALQQLQKERRLQVVPLGFMRGRTFDDAFIVADEMQNCTGAQMRMLLTRLGLHSRLVLTGDLQQCDRALHDNGLRRLLDSLRAAVRGEEEQEQAPASADASADAVDDDDEGSVRAAVARDFALHELDASSVQRHAAVRTVLRLLGGSL